MLWWVGKYFSKFFNAERYMENPKNDVSYYYTLFPKWEPGWFLACTFVQINRVQTDKTYWNTSGVTHLCVLLVLKSERPWYKYTHRLCTVVGIWRWNMSDEHYGECEGANPTVCWLWLVGGHSRVDDLPNPEIETRSLLWYPQLAHRTILS